MREKSFSKAVLAADLDDMLRENALVENRDPRFFLQDVPCDGIEGLAGPKPSHGSFFWSGTIDSFP